MGLSECHGDVLLVVADVLDYRSLGRLLRTCKRFADLLEKYMYRRDVRDGAKSLLWACTHSVNDARYQPAALKAIAAGADVNMTWLDDSAPKYRDYRCGINQEVRNSPMSIAVGTGDTSLARLLIERGADINLAPCPGYAPIIVAAVTGQTSFVRFLIEMDVDLAVADPVGAGPLAVAARHGDFATVEALLAAVEDADEKAFGSDRTALFEAVENDSADIVALLLESNKAEPALDAMNGETVMERACECGTVEIVELLCDDGRASVNRRVGGVNRRNGRRILPPIELAAAASHWDVVLYLLELGRVRNVNWEDLFRRACTAQDWLLAEELIWRTDMTAERARVWKPIAVEAGYPRLLDGISRRHAEWEDGEPPAE